MIFKVTKNSFQFKIEKSMIYGYLRVSTGMQDIENQKSGIVSFAQSRGMIINSWVNDDGVSGTKEPEDRLLGKLLKKVKKGDTIIASELSRIGRSLYMVMRILENCMKNEVKIITVKDGYELGDNITSKVLAFAFGLAAEIERDMISKRTTEALKRKKSEGLVLGRPMGSKSSKKKLDTNVKKIRQMYEVDNLSMSAISRILKCNRMTVRSCIDAHGFLKTDNKYSKNLPKTAFTPISLGENEFFDEYKKTFSMTDTARYFGYSPNGLYGWAKREGFYDRIVELNQQQRHKVKSKKQIERDSLVQ